MSYASSGSEPGRWPLGASTLGAPGESLAVVLEWCVRAGVSQLELRVAEGQPVDIRSTPEVRARVRAQIADSGIELLALDSYVQVGALDASDEQVVRAIEEHLRLAADMGARFLRLFPGAPTRPTASAPAQRFADSGSENRMVDRLLAIVDTARNLEVTAALETHDSHARGEDLARVLAALGRQSPDHGVGAVWDFVHPFRMGERPERTWSFLGPYLLHSNGFVQVKDIASAADPTPVLVGTGAVPLHEILTVLAAGGYGGPLSLEWERTWHPEIPALPLALQSLTEWLTAARITA